MRVVYLNGNCKCVERNNIYSLKRIEESAVLNVTRNRIICYCHQSQFNNAQIYKTYITRESNNKDWLLIQIDWRSSVMIWVDIWSAVVNRPKVNSTVFIRWVVFTLQIHHLRHLALDWCLCVNWICSSRTHKETQLKTTSQIYSRFERKWWEVEGSVDLHICISFNFW